MLYERYYKVIFVFVWKRTLNETITADITSQVFLKAMINLKNYKHRNLPFSAWLFRIALSELMLHFRKNKLTQVVSADDNHLLHLIDECKLNEEKEKQELIVRAMQELTETEMQLIQLRFFDENSFAEVANILGITENNAKVKTYRTIDKLKAWCIKNNIQQ